MHPWWSVGAFPMTQASTQMGYWSRWKDARSWFRHAVGEITMLY